MNQPPLDPSPPPVSPRMAPPPPPSPVRKPFSVNPIALVLAVLTLPLWIWLSMRVNPNDSGYAVGSVVGAWVVQFLVATFGAWIAWLVFGRRRLASTATFCVLFFFCTGGSTGAGVLKASRERRSETVREALDSLNDHAAIESERVRKEQLAQLDGQGYADPDFDLSTQTADLLDERAAALAGPEGHMLLAQAAWLRKYRATFEPYFARINDFVALGGGDPATFTGEDSLDERIAIVTELTETNRSLINYLRTSAQRHASAMVAEGVPRSVANEATRGFATGANFDAQIRLRESDTIYYKAIQRQLTILKKAQGQWWIGDDALVYFDEGVPAQLLEDFDAAADEANEQMEIQARLQREILTTPAP